MSKEKRPTVRFDVKRLDEHIFTLDFSYDYHLDEMLALGVGSVLKLARAVQKQQHLDRAPKTVKGDFACTTFNAFTANGEHLLARNFDYKDAPCLLVRTHPANGYRSISMTDMNLMLYGAKHTPNGKNEDRLFIAPFACMDGINEKGLAIAVLELKTKATKQNAPGKPAILTPVAIRAALDTCATVDEAIGLFGRYNMHHPLFCDYHYHVADAEGNSAVIEYVNGEMRVVRPENKLQYAMNFFLSPDGICKKPFGFTREKWVKEAMGECGGVMEESDAMRLLEKCRLNYRHRRGYMITSLWSAVYNCSERAMLLSAGMDYSKTYRFSVNEEEP